MIRLRAAAVILALSSLAGCASMLSWESNTYVVQPGDTLYKIAWRYSLDYRDLADWNGLGSGNIIHAGQSIRLTPPEGWDRRARTSGQASAGSAGSSGSAARSARARARAGSHRRARRWCTAAGSSAVLSSSL